MLTWLVLKKEQNTPSGVFFGANCEQIELVTGTLQALLCAHDEMQGSSGMHVHQECAVSIVPAVPRHTVQHLYTADEAGPTQQHMHCKCFAGGIPAPIRSCFLSAARA